MKPGSVLHVEDDANDAYFMQRAFERLKIPEVLRIVRDGSDAIRLLESTGDGFPSMGSCGIGLAPPR